MKRTLKKLIKYTMLCCTLFSIVGNKTLSVKAATLDNESNTLRIYYIGIDDNKEYTEYTSIKAIDNIKYIEHEPKLGILFMETNSDVQVFVEASIYDKENYLSTLKGYTNEILESNKAKILKTIEDDNKYIVESTYNGYRHYDIHICKGNLFTSYQISCNEKDSISLDDYNKYIEQLDI